jgi:hypothetical protein
MEIFLCLPIPITVGFVISLLVFIPPIRTLAQSSQTLKLILVFTLSLVSFFIIYGLLTYESAYGTYYLGDWQYECQSCDRMVYIPPEFTQEEKEHEKAIIIEYWSRELLPPVVQSSCNTKHPTVCQLADNVNSRNMNSHHSPSTARQVQWNMFRLYFVFSFCSSISAAFFVARFTRREDVHS